MKVEAIRNAGREDWTLTVRIPGRPALTCFAAPESLVRSMLARADVPPSKREQGSLFVAVFGPLFSGWGFVLLACIVHWGSC